jgi:hypothetical protein
VCGWGAGQKGRNGPAHVVAYHDVPEEREICPDCGKGPWCDISKESKAVGKE